MSRTTTAVLAATAAAASLVLSACSGPAAAPVAATADCTPAHSFTTISAGKLTVAAPEFAPFVTLTGGTPSGIDVDIVAEIAKLECLTAEYLPVEYSGAVPAVQSGRADIAIGDYYRTTSRAEIVGLTEALYYDGMGIISKDGITDIATIITRPVGTVDGYLWVADMKKLLGDGLKIYKSNVEMWADLNAGRIEVGIDSIPVSNLHLKDNPGFKVGTVQADDRVGASVKPAQVGLPYTKENAALGTALNEDIVKLRTDGVLASIFTAHEVDPKETEVTDSYLLES